jgi:4-hydroxy-2-oxoheptanedioate aldolase
LAEATTGPSFALRKILATGKPLVFPWVGTPGAALAGQIARLGFDAVALDLQHSSIDLGEAAKMVTAINAVGVPTILRVRWNDPGIVGFALDMGAAAVIAPMTNSVAQVEALVKAAKYPPVGQRSWGGYTMLQAAGVAAGEYLKAANSETLVLAMIETQEALDAVEAIASVPGLDGLFVGPSDLSIALSNGAKIDRMGQATITAMKRVSAAAKKSGIVAGAFAGTTEAVKAYADIGFTFMAGPTDTDLMRAGATAFIEAVR